MAKRIAEKELTDRNWDQEDEAEEVQSGSFSGFLLSVFKFVLRSREECGRILKPLGIHSRRGDASS